MNKAQDIQQLNLDKSTWSLVKFGDVVFEPKEKAKDPANEGIEHVVGLEHIEPEDIHLRRSNGIEQSTTFTKKFSIGDVLFGRRRAYLKKAAQASFSGICSGDITIMRAKESLMPELLPFIVNNDKFFDWAITHSAGGLSPRCKFKDLANYEFLLPPKVQQSEIAQLLRAMDEVHEQRIGLRDKMNSYLMSFRSSFLGELSSNDNRIVQIADVGSKTKQAVQVGPFGGSVSSRHFVPAGVPVIKINNLGEEGELDLSNLVYVSHEHADSLARYRIQCGDLLTAAQATTGRSAIADSRIEGALISQHLIRVAVDNSLCLSEYVFEVFSSQLIKHQIDMVKAKTTRDGLNTADVSSFRIPLPELCQQRQFIHNIALIRGAIVDCERELIATQVTKKSLINQIF